MSKARGKASAIWNYYTKTGSDFKAICSLCNGIFSYKSTTGNLSSHLRKTHSVVYSKMNNETQCRDDEQDDASNSSIKFSSEIWEQFEQRDGLSHCTICKKTTENTIEDMKSHLEEDHPGILISILNNKPTDTSEDDRIHGEDEAFTEVIYLEEEQKPQKKVLKRLRPSKPLVIRSFEAPKSTTQRKSISEQSQVSSVRPEIDTFLSYIGVMLRNVPKEAIPKLQLDVISLILNAQISSAPSDIATMPVKLTNDVCSTEDIHIVIQNEESSG